MSKLRNYYINKSRWLTHREQRAEQVEAGVTVSVLDHVHLGGEQLVIAAHLQDVHNLTQIET